MKTRIYALVTVVALSLGMAALLVGCSSPTASEKTVAVFSNRPLQGTVYLAHEFKNVEEKDEFMQQVFDVFGKKEGVLLASLELRYTYDLGQAVLVVEDNTGNRGVPWVGVSLTNKAQPAHEH